MSNTGAFKHLIFIRKIITYNKINSRTGNMLVKRLLFLFMLVAVLANWTYSQQQSTIKKSEIIESINGKDYYLHFVKQGETLFEIAKAYGITVDNLFKANPASRGGIKPGQILKIPLVVKKTDDRTAKDSNKDYFVHIVQPKETFYGISRKYGVGIEDIKKLNPETGESLQEGQALKIPTVKADDTVNPDWNNSYVSHTVVQGETLYGIAREYEVTIGEIKNANPGLTNQLTIGNKINIPNQLGELPVSPSEKPKDRFIKYQIKPNESIYVIAKDHAVSVDSIVYYNSGLTDAFEPGQVIRIPLNTSTKNYIIHKSDKKDKLQNIAALYQVNYYDVLLLNPGVTKKVNKDQLIKIPVVVKDDRDDQSGSTTELLTEDLNPCRNVEENMSRMYNIALMLPLYLEEIDSLENREEKDISDLKRMSSFRFMNFYEGFLMAVDSMKNAGMKLNLFVYDVDNSEEKINRVLNATELSGMDLIIGPLFNNAFKKLADFAKVYEINIINPLSEREEVIFKNPYVFKMKPPVSTQLDELIVLIQDQYPESNVVIIRHNKYKYQSEVSYIRNSLNSSRIPYLNIHNEHIVEVIKEQNYQTNLLTENQLFELEPLQKSMDDSTMVPNTVKEILYVNDSTEGLKMNLSLVRPNVVIVFSSETVFTQLVMSQLNKKQLKYDITLFGLPEWNKFTNLETSHMLNLNLHCFTASYVDYDNEIIKEWILKYRELYYDEPTIGNYAFDGFDIGWYFLNALYLFGNEFSACIENFDIELIQSKYKFEQLKDNGFENIYWNIGEYIDYKFIKVQDIQ